MTAVELLEFDNLQNRIILLENEVIEKERTILHLEEQLDWFKRQIFGRRSERLTSDLNSQQMELEGFEAKATKPEEISQTVPAHQRRKPNRNGQDAITLDPNLPVKTIVLDLPEADKICKETGLSRKDR